MVLGYHHYRNALTLDIGTPLGGSGGEVSASKSVVDVSGFFVVPDCEALFRRPFTL